MANKGLSMRKVREVLRLHHVAGLSGRAIARSLKVSPVTVTRYIRRAEEAGLSWPLPESLDDAQLERRLLPGAASMPGETRFPVPEWSTVHRELRRKGVTLALLWQEYKETHPEGMQYSRFCQMYRAWAAKLDVVMRFEHRAGEKTFVDYAGHTVEVVERQTGELRSAQVFVAVLGASSYTYAEATWTQALPDWVASHVRAFEFYGGCGELLIPDNLRSAVSRAHRYEPDINPTYHDLARHCCFPLYLVGSPRDLTELFRRRISWDDGVIRDTSDRSEVAFFMNDCCRSGGDGVARAASVGKGCASAAHLSMPCPHGP